MIFVTVGTHEQNFDRLISEIDKLVEEKIIDEEVFIQIGYSNFIPKNCKYKKLISYDEMNEYTKKARCIITHGGPGSIFLPIQYNKKPIVVPRNPKFGEHVDEHQMDFVKRMYNSNKVEMVLDISELKDKIIGYQNYSESNYNNNKEIFLKQLDDIVKNMFKYN